jgi:molybdopterin-containing oxidoreductase family membrane subunit
VRRFIIWHTLYQQVLNLNKTVGWAWDITNFVWWLVLVMQELNCSTFTFPSALRMAINRSAEATIFSVIQAGLFPIIHMGRP